MSTTNQDAASEKAVSDLAALLRELIDELKLGKTARLDPLLVQTRSLVSGMFHDLSPDHKSTEGTGPFPVVDETDPPPSEGNPFVEVVSPWLLRTEDRLVSDLDQIQRLCWGLQLPEPDPQAIEKLELLAARIEQAMEGGKTEPASAPPPTATSTQVQRTTSPRWSKVMPKKRMAELLDLTVGQFTSLHRGKLDPVSAKAWRIDLDQLDGAERDAIEDAQPKPRGKPRGRTAKKVASK